MFRKGEFIINVTRTILSNVLVIGSGAAGLRAAIAAHTVLAAGDYTGREIMYTLNEKAADLEIPVYEHQYISRLLVEDGICFGAFGFDITTDQRTIFLADAVILAAGGHTRLWRRSSSRRDENTGDGMNLALQAGIPLVDMELVQFHTTGMLTPEDWPGTLVT